MSLLIQIYIPFRCCEFVARKPISRERVTAERHGGKRLVRHPKLNDLLLKRLKVEILSLVLWYAWYIKI